MNNKEIESEQIDINAGNYTDEIADVAYSYWETRGRADGHDVADWLMAEQEVLRRHSLMRPSGKEEAHKTAIGSAA